VRYRATCALPLLAAGARSGQTERVGRRGNRLGVGHVQRSVRLAVLLLMLIGICSCGDSSNAPSAVAPPAAGTLTPSTVLATTTASPPAPTEALPATTLLVMPTRDDALLADATPTHVTEPCPDSPGGPDGTEAMQTEMAKVEPMLAMVLAYGGQHPDEFGSYGLVWHGTNDASVFISFTTNLDRHREALNKLVAHPDELIVCQVAVCGDVALALVAKLTDDLNGRFSSVGVGINGVEVVLQPGEEALADQLVGQYDEAVNVTVCSGPATCTGTLD
jgi:hypothetical protein